MARANIRPSTFVMMTDPKARKSVFHTAPSSCGSAKIFAKFSKPVISNEPRPVQFVKAKNPPVRVAAYCTPSTRRMAGRAHHHCP